MAQAAMTTTTGAAPARKAGVAQGVTVVASTYVGLIAVLALPPVLPSMAAAFRTVPRAASLVPLLVAIPGLMVALLALSAGSVLDRFGRRKPFLLAMALYVVAGVVPAFVGNFALIAASRVAVGIGQAVVMVAASTLLIDYFSDTERRTWLTVQGLLLSAAAPATAALAGFIGARSWQYAFLLHALLLPVLIGIFLFCFEPETKPEQAEEQAAGRPFPWRLAIITSAMVIFTATFFFIFLIHAGLALNAVGVTSPSQIGGLIAITTLGGPFGVTLFNVASRKLSTGALMGLTAALLAIGVLGVGASPNKVVLVAFGFIQQIGGGMLPATMIFWAGQLFLPEHRGRGLGLFNAATFLGQFLCVPLLNVTQTAAGGLQPALLALGCIGVAGAATIAFVARPKVLNSLDPAAAGIAPAAG